jgi:basic membrane protein A
VKVAPQYSDVVFGGIDIFFEEPAANTLGLNFKEQEAAYLAGVVAGMLTTMTDVDDRINDKKVVGFVGGMEIPPVQKFEAGFVAGVKSVAPDVEVKSVYTGSFTDQQKGLESGKNLIEQGADIIFAAAGATGNGTAKACQDNKALFIGVDADQYNTIAGIGDTIVTSAIKRVDNAVYLTVKDAVDGTLKAGENKIFGLAEDGVGLAPYHDWDAKMPQDIKDAVDKATADIKAGTVTVPETK